MSVLGFNYTKLSAEKKKPVKGKVNISNNVSVADVEETEISLDNENNAVRVKFKYTSSYKPEVAKISIEGDVLYLDEDKSSEEIIKEWKENRKLPKEAMKKVINFVLGKCNVQAIILSRDMNIPSPIPLPKVGEGNGKKSKKD